MPPHNSNTTNAPPCRPYAHSLTKHSRAQQARRSLKAIRFDCSRTHRRTIRHGLMLSARRGVTFTSRATSFTKTT